MATPDPTYKGSALAPKLLRRRDRLKSWVLVLIVLAAFLVVGYFDGP